MSAFTEANRKAFDELSSTYNTQPWQLALSAQITEALRARVEWISPLLVPQQSSATSNAGNGGGQEVKLLDFASGTGNASLALAPFVTQIRGIDISPQMVKAYNSASSASSPNTPSPSSPAYAVEGDLFAAEGPPPQLTTPEFSNFDLAVIALGFHHFENPSLALSRLYDRLKPLTGVLCIVDFLPFSPSSSSPSSSSSSSHQNHPASPHHHDGSGAGEGGMDHTIKHHGFTPESLQDLFTKAGFADFEIMALKKPAVMKGRDGEMKERTLFIARGRKAGSWWEKLGGWVGGMQEVVGGQMDVQKSGCGGGGWNPGVKTERKEEGEGGGGGGWDMLGNARGQQQQQQSGEREGKRGWNGF